MAQFVRRIGKDITAGEYARLRGQSWPNAWQDLRNFPDTMAFIRMFLFFSNGIGLGASIAISVLLTLVLLYACSG
jgi:hypothetical protein